MRLHWIQHVPFEGLGFIESWANKNGHTVSVTRIYENHDFPAPSDIDLLVVMGGPMGVYDEDEFSWLSKEKQFIRKAVEEGVRILGICLGAQLLADVLGASVSKNPEKEIGWFRVSPEKSYKGRLSGIFDDAPEVFHWHGDTFGIPEGADLICSSVACINQAFEYKDRVFGLQFHLETTPSSALDLINNCGHEIEAGGNFIQSAKDVSAEAARFERLNSMMALVLDRILK